VDGGVAARLPLSPHTVRLPKVSQPRRSDAGPGADAKSRSGATLRRASAYEQGRDRHRAAPATVAPTARRNKENTPSLPAATGASASRLRTPSPRGTMTPAALFALDIDGDAAAAGGGGGGGGGGASAAGGGWVADSGRAADRSPETLGNLSAPLTASIVDAVLEPEATTSVKAKGKRRVRKKAKERAQVKSSVAGVAAIPKSLPSDGDGDDDGAAAAAATTTVPSTTTATASAPSTTTPSTTTAVTSTAAPETRGATSASVVAAHGGAGRRTARRSTRSKTPARAVVPPTAGGELTPVTSATTQSQLAVKFHILSCTAAMPAEFLRAANAAVFAKELGMWRLYMWKKHYWDRKCADAFALWKVRVRRATIVETPFAALQWLTRGCACVREHCSA
jgi:hypothetical protein